MHNYWDRRKKIHEYFEIFQLHTIYVPYIGYMTLNSI